MLMDGNAGRLSADQSQFKYMPCRYCGKPMKVTARKRKLPSHVECGITVAIEVQRQIHEKKGPHYDKWLAGQLAYLERLSRGGPPLNGGG
jgi:hypothetical protein